MCLILINIWLIWRVISYSSEESAILIWFKASVGKRIEISLQFCIVSELPAPRWWFPVVDQTNCCYWLLHIPLMPCSFIPPAPRSSLLHICWAVICRGQSFAHIVCSVRWLSGGELRQTLIGGTGSCAPYLLWACAMLRCGNPIIPPIRNLLWQGQQHRAPGYHLSSQQIGSCNTRQTDGSSSCWGPGWSGAVASCLHDWRAEKWRGGLVIKERGGSLLIHLTSHRCAA